MGFMSDNVSVSFAVYVFDVQYIHSSLNTFIYGFFVLCMFFSIICTLKNLCCNLYLSPRLGAALVSANER